MGQANAVRTQVQEGAYTITKKNMALVLLELDSRITGADVFIDITRAAGLITLIEYFSDVARSNKTAERSFTRTAGVVTDVVTKFFNDDATEDSRVTETITRDGGGLITECDSVFSTGEETKI